jgi:tRNA threonylcarbamoyladenosine biosynthesis protein TsaB
MIILAIDTSGKNGSLALAQVTPGQRELKVLEVVPLAGGTFSAELVPQISHLLQKHGFGKRDLAGFAVASGPGSFTGLRVGLAAVKALSEILHQPVASVSLLEAVARSAKGSDRVLAVLDAGRGEMYVGDFDRAPSFRRNHERLLTKAELSTAARNVKVITPDVKIAEELRVAGVQVEQVDYPRSDIIARLGWERLQRGDIVLPEDLEANYIRRSDAEIFSKPKD